MFEFKSLKEANQYLANNPSMIPYVTIKEVTLFDTLKHKNVKRYQIITKPTPLEPVNLTRVTCSNTLKSR